MKHEDCLFCKIIDGEVPSAKVYEDEHVYAFIDIGQVTEGHTLVIPKQHAKDIYDLSSETAKELFSRIPKLAQAVKDAYHPVGLNIVNNNGEFAGQTIYHVHLHLIPRYDNEDGFDAKWVNRSDQYEMTDLEKIAENISSSL